MGLRDALNALVYGDRRPATVPPDLRAGPGPILPVPQWQVGRPTWPDRGLESYRAAFDTLPTVHACVEVRSRAVSAASVRVVRRQPDGQEEPLPDHPLRRLLRAPNPRTSETEFLAQISVFLDVAGFALVEKVRGRAGVVSELWHLRPDWATPVYRSDGMVDWRYRVPGRQEMTLAAEDVVLVTGGTTATLAATGQSPIAVAFREVGIEQSATDFLKSFFERGGVPQVALVSPEPIEDQARADAIKARWQQAYGGAANWSNVGLLTGGPDVRQLGLDIEKMAYPELRRMLEARVCQVFGVPPVVVGAQVGLDASTYSNYETARRTFYQDTIVPLWARIDGALTRSLLPEMETDAAVEIAFDLSDIPALQEDIAPAWVRAQGALAAGLITLNQAQAEVGLAGFGPDGDVLYVPAMVVPTPPSQLLVAPEPLVAPVPDAVPDAVPPEGEPVPADDAAAEASRGLAVRSMLLDGEVVTLDRPVWRLPAEQRALSAAVSRAQITRIANAYQPALAEHFRRMAGRLADAAERSGDGPPETRDVADLATFDWEGEREELRDLLTRLYGTAGEAAYRRAAAQVKVDVVWDMAHPYVRQVMSRVGHATDTIHATSVERVREIVTAGLEEGVTMPDLAERLRADFAGSADRAMTVARTESRIAYGHAAVAAYKQTGKVAAAELMDNPTHGDYDGDEDGYTCATRNGLVVDLDDVARHVEGTHPRCILCVAPILYSPLGEEANG